MVLLGCRLGGTTRTSGEVESIEVWLSGTLHKYAYYWLTPTGAVLQGWDNAPHHPQIATSPHHTHTPNGIASSHVRSLIDVLAEIEKLL